MLKQKEASKNSSYDMTNGLRLAKIAYERNAILDFFVSEDYMLNLLAIKNIEGNISKTT
jgi:hypothetical protein